MRIVLTCLSLIFAPAALAQPSAQEAYEAGDWAYAQSLGTETADADSLALASQAALTPLLLGDMVEADRLEKRDRARTAGALAHSALDIDPDHAGAHLSLAAALSYEARYTNPLAAALARLPQRARTHTERAVALAPSDPWAQALLGAWHLEVVRRAGERTFGADSETGLQHYRAAAAIADTPDIPYSFALALLARDAETHGEEAIALLDRAVAMETDAAFETAMRADAAELLDLTRTFRAAAAEEAVRRLEQ